MEKIDTRKYIYNFLSDKKYSQYIDTIYTYIIDKHIPHTLNNNGMFINLSVLDTDYIILLSEYINNLLSNIYESKDNSYKQIDKQDIIKKQFKANISIPSIVYKKLQLPNFEKHILSFSL